MTDDREVHHVSDTVDFGPWVRDVPPRAVRGVAVTLCLFAAVAVVSVLANYLLALKALAVAVPVWIAVVGAYLRIVVAEERLEQLRQGSVVESGDRGEHSGDQMED